MANPIFLHLVQRQTKWSKIQYFLQKACLDSSIETGSFPCSFASTMPQRKEYRELRSPCRPCKLRAMRNSPIFKDVKHLNDSPHLVKTKFVHNFQWYPFHICICNTNIVVNNLETCTLFLAQHSINIS